MHDHILLPTDGSAGMARVIEHALWTARTHEATLHALYVVDSGSVTGVPMDTTWHGLSATLEQEGERALDEVARRAGETVPLERAVREGRPSREIVAHAEEQDADLVVMGTHGRGGIDRLLLGSVAERVVRRASIPVTTVRHGPDTGMPRIDSDLDPQHRDGDDHDPPPDHREPEPGTR